MPAGTMHNSGVYSWANRQVRSGIAGTGADVEILEILRTEDTEALNSETSEEGR